MSKALGAKLSPADAPQDLLAGLWGLAQLGAKADAGMLSKAAGVIKAAVGELSTEQQVYAAWSFALLGQVGVLGGLLAGQQAVAAAMLCRRSFHNWLWAASTAISRQPPSSGCGQTACHATVPTAVGQTPRAHGILLASFRQLLACVMIWRACLLPVLAG